MTMDLHWKREAFDLVDRTLSATNVVNYYSLHSIFLSHRLSNLKKTLPKPKKFIFLGMISPLFTSAGATVEV